MALAARRPGEPEPRLDVAPVGLHADGAADERLAGVEVEIGEAVVGLALRRGHHVGQPQGQGQGVGHPPGVVDEAAELLPPPPLHRAVELVVAAARRRQPEQQAGDRVAGGAVERAGGVEAGGEERRERELAGQRRVAEQVQLHRPEGAAGVDRVVAPHHRQRVAVVVDVGAALERREAAVADADEVLERHAGERRGLVGAEVGAGNAQLARLVGAVAERGDVVVDPVVAGGELVDGTAPEHARVRQRHVEGVGVEGLVAGEPAGGPEVGQAGRQVLVGFLEAEAARRRGRCC